MSKPNAKRERLLPLRRHDAELGGLDLFSRLDRDPTPVGLADEKRVDAAVARFREGVLTSLKHVARVHGWHTQLMFAEVVRGLGKAVLLTEDDQGSTWARPSDDLQPGDYRVVLPDGRNLAIEVKNHRGLTRPLRMKAADLQGLVRYAELTRTEPRVAIYWSRPGLWFLVDPARFTVTGDKASIDMNTAMAENDMADLGDMMIGMVPPLEFRIDFEETPPYTEFDSHGRRQLSATIRGTSISAGGRRLRARAERRLAFYLLWNGRWPETEHDDFVKGRLKAIRFSFEPEEWRREQGFAILGFYSELIARSFWLRTSEEGVVTRLRAELDPASEGLVIPDDYKSKSLPLWRMRLQPRGGAPPPESKTSKAGAAKD